MGVVSGISLAAGGGVALSGSAMAGFGCDGEGLQVGVSGIGEWVSH